jgi:hypothetical protein
VTKVGGTPHILRRPPAVRLHHIPEHRLVQPLVQAVGGGVLCLGVDRWAGEGVLVVGEQGLNVV